MSLRVLSILVLPAGMSVAAAAAGFQIVCQEGEQPGEKKAGEREEKATKSLSSLSNRGKGTQKCNLTGQWRNELGSEMQVFEVGNDGSFFGEYLTAVSSTEKPIQLSPLNGSQHLDEDGQCTFGFTVNWKTFSDSTAVFVGQCFNGNDGKEVLHTSWLLREKVDSELDDWKATRTGRNTFTRICRKEEEASYSGHT